MPSLHKPHPFHVAANLHVCRIHFQSLAEHLHIFKRHVLHFVPVVSAFQLLGKGFLTGAMTKDTKFGDNDLRKNLPRFIPEAMEKNQALIELLKRIAGEKKATPAQIALAWLLAQKPWIVPIPGTTKLHRLEENLGAANIKLTVQYLAGIKHIAAGIHVEGERYPVQLMATTGR
jgi:aryl-alcohol dehydrogenase-like predicted oxidoreductase